MNRNQKIALGCGGSGCLGIIVVIVAGGLIYFFSYRRSPPTNRDYDFNVNSNRSTNLNSATNDNANANDGDNNNSSTSTSATSLSNDEKHRLFQAASMTADAELVRRVSVKIGLMSEDYTPGADYQDFVSEHVDWGLRNTEFIQSIATQEKARAYVNEHFPD